MTELSNRRFGVEIECGSRIHTAGTIKPLLTKKFPHWKNIGSDGSGIEVRSPILQGQSGLDELGEIMAWLLTEGECYVGWPDGLHVHHDAPEFADDWDALLRLTRSWYNCRQAALSFVARRRHTHSPLTAGACAILATHADTISRSRRLRNKPKHSYFGHRYELNFGAVRTHGSVEWRQKEGVLDFPDAAAWILFGQRFMDRAAEAPRKFLTPENPGANELLLRRLRITGEPKKQLLKEHPDYADMEAQRAWLKS